MRSFSYKTPMGEEAVIKDVPSLPRCLYMSLCFNRDRMLSGSPNKCVQFNLFRMRDEDDQPVSMPANFRWATDDELQALRMTALCMLIDTEKEMEDRKAYMGKVSGEITGMTGINPTFGCSGQEGVKDE